MAKKAKKTPKTRAAGPASDRQKRLDEAFGLMQSTFGKEGVFLGDRGGNRQNIEIIPTGSATLDHASGVGGFPRGRIIEIYGPEASGKTTLAIHAIAEAQKKGLVCAFIDAEHALDTKYAEKIGVNVDELLIAQPDYGEQAIEMIESLSNAKAVDLIVLDSVAALIPKAELEGDLEKAQVGIHARLMSKAFRRITGALQKANVLCIMINQTRTNVGVMYGNPEVTTGGKALKFYASMRIRVGRGEKKQENGKFVGHALKCKFEKNKMAPPFVECVVPLMYGVGFDIPGDTLTICLELGIVELEGRSYSYKGEKFATSKGAAFEYLRDNKEFCDELIGKLKEHRANDGAVDLEDEIPEVEDVTSDIELDD